MAHNQLHPKLLCQCYQKTTKQSPVAFLLGVHSKEMNVHVISHRAAVHEQCSHNLAVAFKCECDGTTPLLQGEDGVESEDL